jgi:hypothetical protein
MNRSAVIEQAKKWIGKNESDGSHKEIIDIYNRRKPLPRGYKVKYTDKWCAPFVSAVFIALGYDYDIPVECSCGKMISLAQNAGIWVENDAYIPKPADIILYDWDDNGIGDNTGWADHIGIVEKVENGVITVIEGNFNNAVARREIAINGRYIRGYITPKYDTEKEETIETSKVEYYPQHTGTSNSLVDALKSLGIDSSMNHRKEIAKANGIENYKGTAQQNGKMLSLLKQGKLIKSGSVANTGAVNSASRIEYYAKYTGGSNSLVDALKSLKIDSSFNHRKQIAKANEISLYVGLANQNVKLLTLLKQGKLVKE